MKKNKDSSRSFTGLESWLAMLAFCCIYRIDVEEFDEYTGVKGSWYLMLPLM